MAGAQVWLQVEYREVWCDTCGRAKVEYLSFANASQRVTHRLARYVHGLCKHMTVKVIKRRAYGYHDSHYFALKVKQAFAA